MPTPDRTSKLGIIAGGGALPGLLIAACQTQGRSHYVLGLSGFADGATDASIKLGEFGKGLDFLRTAGVREIVMAGAVRRPALSELKPDLKGAAFLARIAGRVLGDDGLLSAVIGEIEREGFKVVGVDDVLEDLLAKKGVWGRHQPDAAALVDIALGFSAARALGAADVGQAVVIQQGAVLGVEGTEGTDALLAYCADVLRDGPGGILVKVKKPQQERRADLPSIGVTTVARAKAAGLRGIAVQAGHTLVIGLREMIAAADAAGIFVMGTEA